MRERIVTNCSAFLICMLLPLFFPNWGKAATRIVCGDCVIRTVSEGIKASSAGDTLIIEAGLYREPKVTIDRKLTLIGRGEAIIDGAGNGGVVRVTADSVTISGLHIRNSGASYIEDWAGIRVVRRKYARLIGNTLSDNCFGIYLEHCRDSEVTGNRITSDAEEEASSGNGVHLWYCKRIQVRDNRVSGHRDGIYFEFVDHSDIEGNVCEDNLRYGLHFMFSNDDAYYRNEFRRNGAGVAVMFSKRIEMRENIFELNWGRSAYGILLKEIYDAEIIGNEFRQNTTGIFVEGSSRIKYLDNDFMRNGWAIRMSGGCLDNEITKNNFIANTFDLALGSHINNNTFNGNYWGEYRGYDLDRDGVGDVPYRPMKLFSYVVSKTPEAVVLLRSLFIDLLNFTEKVSPVFTPENVKDLSPAIRPFS